MCIILQRFASTHNMPLLLICWGWGIYIYLAFLLVSGEGGGNSGLINPTILSNCSKASKPNWFINSREENLISQATAAYTGHISSSSSLHWPHQQQQQQLMYAGHSSSSSLCTLAPAAAAAAYVLYTGPSKTIA